MWKEVLSLRSIQACSSLHNISVCPREAKYYLQLTKAEGITLCPDHSAFLGTFISAPEDAMAQAGGPGKQSQELTSFC